MKKAIPDFETDTQAERFIETADLSGYDLSGFKATAKARGIPYTRFVRETLERVVQLQSGR